MILTKQESVLVVLNYAKNNFVSSKTKLNKLVALLNLYMIPVDVNFTLNKFGSYDGELGVIESNEFIGVENKNYSGIHTQAYYLGKSGKKEFELIKKKVLKIIDLKELDLLKGEINELSQLDAIAISEEKHEKLKVNIEDRNKLKFEISDINISLLDLYNEIDSITEKKIVDIKFKGLLEFCYHLSNYLNKKVKKFSNNYVYEEPMLTFYLIKILFEQLPKFKEQMNERNEKWVNRMCGYFFDSLKSYDYPFSLRNSNLLELID